MDRYRERPKKGIGWMLCPGIFIAAVIFLSFSGRSMEETAVQEQEELLRQAVNQAVVNCYAVEGRYPESLEYLEENYGIRVNQEEYIVLYEVFADNVKPRFRIKRIGE